MSRVHDVLSVVGLKQVGRRGALGDATKRGVSEMGLCVDVRGGGVIGSRGVIGAVMKEADE